MTDYSIEAQIKKHYKKIRGIVYHRALRYYIEKDDLLSAVHYKLAKAIETNSFIAESDEQFWAYIHMLVSNTARDYKRRQQRRVMTDDIEGLNDKDHSTLQKDFDMRWFSDRISLELVKRLNKREKIVFKTYFLDGLKYEEAAQELGIPVGSLKAVIFSVRKKANHYFGNQYKGLVA